MRKLLIPMLVVVIVVQSIMLWLGRDGSVNYPRVFVQDAYYIVEVIDDQMEDDSVRAVKYRLKLLADEFGQWYVDGQSSERACWPGRGHKEFSSELCE